MSQNRRRLPPPGRDGKELRGRDVESFSIGSWCPTPDGSGAAVCVAITIRVAGEDLVCRLKSPQAVDLAIQGLLRHKRDVWPDAP